MEKQNKYTIKAVSNITGLSEFVIRVWEKRYSAVVPQRTETNRRLYSDDDVQKLELLHKATQKGHSIGNIHNLSVEQLKEITSERKYMKQEVIIPDPENYESYLSVAHQAISELNPDKLESVLLSASINLNQHHLLAGVLIPLLEKIGTLWEDGNIRVSNEHFASVVISKFMNNYWESFKIPANARRILIAAPMGQYHEFGALLCAIIAASRGWKVIYFGPNLPVADIVAASNQLDVKAVALSFVYPPADISLKTELEKLKYLNRDIKLFAGGRVADTYMDILEILNAEIIHDVFELKTKLDEINY